MRGLIPQDRETVLGGLEPMARSLRGWHGVILGGSGFFGRWLVEALLALDDRHSLGLRVTVTSRDPDRAKKEGPPAFSDRRVEWRKTESYRLGGWRVGSPVDAVIHLVTEGDNRVFRERPDEAMETVVGSTREALEWAQSVGAARILFTSSGAALGPQPEAVERATEDDLGLWGDFPDGHAYQWAGRAKKKAEELCRRSWEEAGLAVVVARAYTFAGPFLPTEGKFAYGNFLADAFAGRDIHIKGDGRAIRSYLYGADLSVWLIHLLQRGRPGRVYHVGSDEPVTMAGLAEAVRRETGRSMAIRIHGARGPVDRYVPSVDRMKAELGLTSTVNLAEGIRRTWRWMNEDDARVKLAIDE